MKAATLLLLVLSVLVTGCQRPGRSRTQLTQTTAGYQTVMPSAYTPQHPMPSWNIIRGL